MITKVFVWIFNISFQHDWVFLELNGRPFQKLGHKIEDSFWTPLRGHVTGAVNGGKEHLLRKRCEVSTQLFSNSCILINPRAPLLRDIQTKFVHGRFSPEVVATWICIAVVHKYLWFVLEHLLVDGNHARVDSIVDVVDTTADNPLVGRFFHVQSSADSRGVEVGSAQNTNAD